jgi:hypothetical protein
LGDFKLRRIREIGTASARYLRLVIPEGVPRLLRQKGVFVKGGSVVDAFRKFWAAKAVFQPVLFRQHEGVRYVHPDRNITQEYLMPADDAFEGLAKPIREKLWADLEKLGKK